MAVFVLYTYATLRRSKHFRRNAAFLNYLLRETRNDNSEHLETTRKTDCAVDVLYKLRRRSLAPVYFDLTLLSGRSNDQIIKLRVELIRRVFPPS